jgi:hypothetical protein
MVSCASTDPVEDPVASTPPVVTPTPETPVTPPPAAPSLSQNSIDALNAAKSLADTNRTLSLEVDGPVYFPNEWNATESQYVQANGSTVAETDAAYQAAADSYNNIAASFEAITLDALPLYAENLRDKGLAERAAAIDAGILDIDSERFLVADDYALSALAAWEINDYETAIINARNAIPRYTALKTGAQAYNVRMNIEDHRFASYDNTAIDTADETAFRAITQYDEGDIAGIASAEKALSDYNLIYSALNTASDAYDVRMEIDYWIGLAAETQAYNASIGIEYGDLAPREAALNAADEDAFLAIDQYDNGNVEDALGNAQKALSEYNSILSQAWVDATNVVQTVAASAQKTARDAKAPVAAKPEFDRADAIYVRGQEFLKAKNYESAAESYYQSVSMFNDVAELAEYKRQQALNAIDEAARKIAESEQTAVDAETRIGGVQ